MQNEQRIALSNNTIIGIETTASNVESDVANRSNIVDFSGVVPSIVGICKDVEKAISAVSSGSVPQLQVWPGASCCGTRPKFVAHTCVSVEANLKISLEWGALAPDSDGDSSVHPPLQ